MEKQIFKTKREEVVDAYTDHGAPFEASTKPYHSTRSLRFEVLDADVVTGVAWALAERGQRLDFFSYGVGQDIDLGGGQRAANGADTNLAKAKSTNGAADYVIEGVGFHNRGMRLEMPDGYEVGIVDPRIRQSVTAVAPSFDPGSLIMPPQFQSPFNLENGSFQSLLGYCSLEFEWDRKRTEKLGVVDLLPQAGAQSYLRANGVPAADNKYRIPEGYIWRRDGQPDSEFNARVELEEHLVIPIVFGPEPVTQAANIAPLFVNLDIVMRLYGLEVELPSGN